MKLSNEQEVVARISRADINMPKYDGQAIPFVKNDHSFEVAALHLAKSGWFRASRLLYDRIPVCREGPKLDVPKDIVGRGMHLFEKAYGERNIFYWQTPEEKVSHARDPSILIWLDLSQQLDITADAARVRAALFNFDIPHEFAVQWLRTRLFKHIPDSFDVPVAPTREFCIAMFNSRIEATIGNLGDMIGWPSDKSVVGPIAAAAKQSLLRFIPHILPKPTESLPEGPLYRFTLEHGDFGIHNVTIAEWSDHSPTITSLFDWATGAIWPAILTDPEMAVLVDLKLDGNAKPSFSRTPGDATKQDLEDYQTWTEHYFKCLYEEAPDYERVVHAARDARYLWFNLKAWRGESSEGFFKDLGDWAEKRMGEFGVECIA